MPNSFTPGPWKHRKGFDGNIEIFNQDPKIQKPFEPVEIAVVNASHGKRQALANARLMVAAPHLLYALQEFVRTMESLPESDETNLRVWDMYRMAQAAIKKAGGES